jgi:ABC-type lipoprotein export system ATPase subunit
MKPALLDSPIPVASKYLFEAKDLTKGFDGGQIQALRGVDLQIGEGEFVVVVGPSGCGKTTLLQILGALDRPSSGTVHYRGQSIADLPDPAAYRAQQIGFIFQAFHLLPTFTAVENVQIPMFEVNGSAVERKERATDLLWSVGLGKRLDHLPAMLSGGERQRVAIARGLANSPAVLLADEPTGNLDSENARSILDLIVRLHREQNMTLLLVTHDMAVARRASRVICMKDGRIGLRSRIRPRRSIGMTFLTIVVRGLMRRPVRTGLTLLGISIGIAAVAISVAIAVAVGVLSGLYPAWRSSQLPPALALQG